jgi:sulfate/thiosulfate transport system ATP-binding protein
LESGGGAWRAGTWSIDGPRVDSAGGAIAYVRPEHLALSAPDGGPGWDAQLRHIYLAGGVAHLDVHVADLDLHLEVDVASDQLGSLEPGSTLRVTPLRGVAFTGAGTRWAWRTGLR